MTEKKNQEELQKKYMEFQMLNAQLKQVQKQLEGIEENVNDLNQTKSNIDGIKSTKRGTEILVPVSNGIFARGTISDNSELLVNVGANTIVNKSIEETKELLDGQMEEIIRFREQLVQALQKLETRSAELEAELAALME